MLEPIFLSTVPIRTFVCNAPATSASGFFFARGHRLFLITSRHVLIDEPSQHYPDRLEIEMHVDKMNLTEMTVVSVPLIDHGERQWRQAIDGSGDVDVAAVEIDKNRLPENANYYAFTPQHLIAAHEHLPKDVEIGSSLLVVGYPLGFHDSLHHLPVARQASVASSYGLRFQGAGYFLTDARTHQGTSGSPVVMRSSCTVRELGDLNWILLGIHSARIDISNRDAGLNEALGLNCAWYADILLTLTEGGILRS